MRERNGSGYFDPTADAAIYKADRKPRRVVRVWRAPEDKPEERIEARSMLKHFEDLDDLREREGGDDGKEDDGGEAQSVPPARGRDRGA